MLKLTLIRHGLTAGNVQDLCYGSTDLPLLPEGVEKLKKMAAQGIYPAAKRFYTSPLIRTQQTLQAIYGDVPFAVIDDLREMPFGALEMMPFHQAREHPLYQPWNGEDFTSYVGPGGESWNMVAQRADRALRTVIARGEDAVCVCHGGVINSVMVYWKPEQYVPFKSMPQPGYGYTFTVEDGKIIACTPLA